MRKSTKMFLMLGSAIPVITMPILSAKCVIFDIPKPNIPKPKLPDQQNPQKPEDLRPAEGYLYWKSSNENFLKHNNHYFFQKLKYEDKMYNHEVFNAQEWKKYIPPIYISDKFRIESPPLVGEFERLEKKGYKDIITLKIQNPADFYNIIRQFSKMKSDSPDILSGGHFKAADNENPKETNARFINEMVNFLGKGEFSSIFADDWNFDVAADHEQEIKETREEHLTHFPFLDYSWEANFEFFINKMFDSNKPKQLSDRVYNIHKGLKKHLANGWKILDDSMKWYLLAFSFGTNSFIQNKFSDAHINPYKDKEAKNNFSGTELYDNYSIVSHGFHNAYAFQHVEANGFKMYATLMKWYQAFLGINKDNEKYWGDIAEENKEELRKASRLLLAQIINYLKWNNFLLMETEVPEAKNKTVADLMPGFEKRDFEHSWVWAYNFLHEILVPCFVANGWNLGLSYEEFENQFTNENYEPSYIYDYIINYLNVIFLDQNKDFKKITKIKELNKINSGNKTQYENKFLNNFINNWNGQLGLNVDSLKLKK